MEGWIGEVKERRNMGEEEQWRGEIRGEVIMHIGEEMERKGEGPELKQ